MFLRFFFAGTISFWYVLIFLFVGSIMRYHAISLLCWFLSAMMATKLMIKKLMASPGCKMMVNAMGWWGWIEHDDEGPSCSFCEAWSRVDAFFVLQGQIDGAINEPRDTRRPLPRLENVTSGVIRGCIEHHTATSFPLNRSCYTVLLLPAFAPKGASCLLVGFGNCWNYSNMIHHSPADASRLSDTKSAKLADFPRLRSNLVWKVVPVWQRPCKHSTRSLGRPAMWEGCGHGRSAEMLTVGSSWG